MKIIGVFLILFLGISCGSAVGQKENLKKKMIPPQQDLTVVNSNPNQMDLTAVLVDFFEGEQELCGIPVKKSMKVKILGASNEGFGISNIPRLNSTIELSADFIELPESLNDTLLIKVGDRLCPNGSVLYEVFHYEKLNVTE